VVPERPRCLLRVERGLQPLRDGKGPAAATLNPRPKNFGRSTIGRGQMAEVIRSGIRGTSMVGFGKTLSDNDIQDVAEYVYRFRDR